MEKMVRKAVLEDMDALHSLLFHVADCHSSKQSDLFCSGRGAYTRAELLRFMETGDMQIFVSTNEAGTVTGLIICRIKETTNHKVLRNARALWVEDMLKKRDMERCCWIMQRSMDANRDVCGWN